MKHQARAGEHLWIYSMGKRFRVRAVTTTVDEANDFMENHRDTALIACFGEFNLIANSYEGIREGDNTE